MTSLAALVVQKKINLIRIFLKCKHKYNKDGVQQQICVGHFVPQV